MKRLAQLWSDVPAAHAAVAVSAVALDSRDVAQGALFIAIQGEKHDARKFIPSAIAAGAVAVFAEQGGEWSTHGIVNGVPVIVIAQLVQEAGRIASRFHDEPSQGLDVLAVTGTNGKTSIANLLAGALTLLGRKTGVLGTIGNGLYGELEVSSHTTLDACRLQAKLHQFRSRGAACVAMEASSHGLVQGRLNGTKIRVALFTNLTRDHLDYHGDMENYAAAKELLFRWPGLEAAVLNADDPAGRRYAEVLAPGVRLLSYSQQADSDAQIRALTIEPGMNGIALRVVTPAGECEFVTPLLGRFNVSNVLAVIGGLLALDIPLADIARVLARAEPVPGRMQSFAGAHPTVVVDYAHTPDALEKVLASLREHVAGQLVCVFGCGGDRDRGKRPQMGDIATRLADQVVITSDNPRSENPQAIIDEIRAGTGSKAVVVELDRRRAIHQAILAAGRDDIVLVAGKGHEDYQEVAGVRHHFSDAEEVRSALTQWRAA
jgi:UDP-N-acetylmuramyl-tripeptide synthetase